MDKNSEAHLIVIRLSALGDVAMTVPVLEAFVRQFPHVRITFLSRPFFKPLFNGLENVTFYPVDVKGKHKGIQGLWRLYKELKGQKIDAVADLHNVLRTNILKRYFSLSKLPYQQIDKGRKEKKELTRKQDKVLVPLKTTFERYADVFRSLGYDLDLEKAEVRPRIELPPALANRFGRDILKWVGIAPFAAFEGKMYPIDKMEEVISYLNSQDNYRIFLFGAGNKENDVLTPISKKYKNAINMIGAMTFAEELALISNLDLMISMDSANGHLASVYGIPAITIWGVTHPYAGFYPFGQDASNALLADRTRFPHIPTSVYGNKFPAGYEKAIETISPDQIIRKAEQLLNE